MKKPVITLAVAALVAFSLGYFAGGPRENASADFVDAGHSAARSNFEASQAPGKSQEKAETPRANPQITTDVVQGPVITSTRTTPRAAYERTKRERLADFFLINGIGAERAEQIIQGLVDADHYITQKGNAIIDRRSAEKADQIAQGGLVSISATAEEKAELEAERQTLYHQVFGEYYEVHEEYRQSYPQRRVVGTFSSSLRQPLDYSAKEAIVRIMYEEQSRLNAEMNSVFAEIGGEGADTPLTWEAEKAKYDAQLLAKRSFSERVLERTKPYLTASQFEQYEGLLEKDIRRFELLIELADIEEPN